MHRHQIAARVFNVPLLVTAEKLQTIVGAIWPVAEAVTPPIGAFDQQDEGGGQPQQRRPYRVTPAGIAVLPVLDTLVRRGSWLDAMSGLTSYDSIRSKLRTALADGAVRGILLDVDSPGGEAGGVFDLADEIRAGRDKKPIWAIANESAFSAAYALACAAEKIWLPRTGMVGSVGVVALFCDQSAQDAAEGLKYTAVYAGERKLDYSPHFPLGKDARANLQGEVDRLYGMFVDTVARNRRLSADAVRATEAGVLNADQALQAKLADRVGTFDDVLAAMAEQVKPRLVYGSQASTVTPIPAGSTMESTADQPGAPTGDRQDNVVDLEAARREGHGAGHAAGEAAAQAYAAEVIEWCSLVGLPHMAAEFIKTKTSMTEVRAKLQAAQRTASAANPISNLHNPGQPARRQATLDPDRIYQARAKAMGQG
ncbi:MAG: S49 family peptidase [Geminicoccaceae bacterium]